jgi:glyoxylase-like metal-dependent hydrolase (beta-lactamase superfamily II)
MIARTFIALACAALLSACAAQTARGPAPASTDIRLYAMSCGAGATSDAGWFSDDGAYDGQPRELVVPCYLIRHPQGDLMWDTGLPETLADLGPAGRTQGPFTFSMARKVTAQLADIGLQPSDIEYVSVSHSHLDHIGNAALFANATWIVDPDEKAHAFRPEARAEAESFAAYAALENRPTRLIEGDGDLDVFGDGTVTIIQAPGHTPGHTVLLVRLPNAGPLLLIGDLWHIAESRPNRRVPRFNTDRAQTLASMDKVERIAQETGARIVLQHVPADFASMPRFPRSLN